MTPRRERPRVRRTARGRAGAAFTLIEILVATAILAILFGLMFRPILMALEVLSIGNAEKRVQVQARSVEDRLAEDLQSALYVYPNLATFDLASFAASSGTAKWRTPQLSRLDIVLAARDAGGRLLTPLQPARDSSGNLQVVTWWLMRDRVSMADGSADKYYDPETNPRRLYRAVHSYPAPAALAAISTRPPDSPGDLWRFATAYQRSQAVAGSPVSLDDLAATVAPLFQRGSGNDAFNWFVHDLDRLNPTPQLPIMRAPTPNEPYTNATRMAAISTLTDQESDIRELSFLPVRADLEELAANANRTAYRGRLGHWVPPYQREIDGQWTLPSNGQVPTSWGYLPLVAMFRSAASRDGAGPLGEEYFISIVQRPTGADRVGHPVVFRMPADPNDDPVPVYDLTEYPVRRFQDIPGNALSGEFACGINWDSGEITTAFSQTDVIWPDTSFTAPRIYALNHYDPDAAIPAAPVPDPGSSAVDEPWQAFALTWREPDSNADGRPEEIVHLNGSLLDDYVLDAANAQAGVWDGYTLSVFRPERLRTGTNVDPGWSARQRRLNMSVVPGSEQVVVEVYETNDRSDPFANGTVPVLRRVYTPLRSAVPGHVSAGDLAPFRYYLDYSTGRLVFYDPQMDPDATTRRDGLNPPTPVDLGGTWRVPVIRVTYQYRNNLPTVEQLATGNDANADSVEATYRSFEAIQVRMMLDAGTSSTRGDDDRADPGYNPSAGGIVDPLGGGSTIARPTGARRRVVVFTTLPVSKGR